MREGRGEGRQERGGREERRERRVETMGGEGTEDGRGKNRGEMGRREEGVDHSACIH